MGHDPNLDRLLGPYAEFDAYERRCVVRTIEAVVLEQLDQYQDELSTGQRKVIADQIAREATRRMYSGELWNVALSGADGEREFTPEEIREMVDETTGVNNVMRGKGRST